jgi:signal transduction histidine kinase
VKLDGPGHAALLEVRNSGPVVPAAAVPGLFEPFRRVRDRLGLSIVRAIAQAHGGTVDASAPTDGGLVVQVMLPLRAPVREQAAALPG